MSNHLNLDTLTLKAGGHQPTDGEMCVMEAVAYFAHEPWSASPKCASRVITQFCMGWNDAMNDEDRQQLVPFIPRIAGTKASAAIEKQRSWMAFDWYCRVSAPAWLRAAGLVAEAEAVEATKPITSPATAKKAQAALDAARVSARAAWAAAWAAARAAAWAAAGDAARAAAGDAARAAAGDAARAAAGDAAGDAAWAAAGDAAWDAAGDAARAAARAAAGAALRPTVVALQASALELLDRMIALSEKEVA